MKIYTFTFLLSLALAGIITFFLTFYILGNNKWVLGIGSFLTLSIVLTGTVSLTFDNSKTTTLTRVTSGIFFVAVLISQIVFTAINSFVLPTYVLVTGGLTIFYAIIMYGISISKH